MHQTLSSRCSVGDYYVPGLRQRSILCLPPSGWASWPGSVGLFHGKKEDCPLRNGCPKPVSGRRCPESDVACLCPYRSFQCEKCRCHIKGAGSIFQTFFCILNCPVRGRRDTTLYPDVRSGSKWAASGQNQRRLKR